MKPPMTPSVTTTAVQLNQQLVFLVTWNTLIAGGTYDVYHRYFDQFDPKPRRGR